MPTYEALPRFTTDLDRLTTEQRRRFRRAVTAFVHDLRAEGRFRAGLRVKRVSGFPGIYELTWSMGTGPAGRATWEFGPERRPGTPHVIWRRIDTHSILTGP
ncbi:hypothetical protein OG936_38200 (plasmid) [Streptomyces sp. NBC_00846]|uniref:hypothetical protein n=1 Tax=Streptomyces sp. NBC_00846 TaxID=2975849 RepID=UPI002F90B98C|nr:hypothetical protein OG936_38200 [Streptomyces sp. NBC_00846]